MEAYKIGFTGNRNGLNNEQIQNIKQLLDQIVNITDYIVLSHGDCVGSDTDFHNLCLSYKDLYPEKKIEIHIYPPNNKTMRSFNKGDILMPEKPYLERNLDIIKNSNILIACPVDKNVEELRSGTWSTIRQANKIKLQTYIF